MLMTGTPSRPSSFWKKGIWYQGLGTSSFMMSTARECEGGMSKSGVSQQQQQKWWWWGWWYSQGLSEQGVATGRCAPAVDACGLVCKHTA
jgi:hypothetical protein